MNEYEKTEKLFKQLVESSFQEFPLKGNVTISDLHGVYIIYSPDEKILHVGRTTRGKKGLNQRLQNHIGGSSSFANEYIKLHLEKTGKVLREGYKFKYIEVDNGRQRALLEALAIGKLCPAHLGIGEKQTGNIINE